MESLIIDLFDYSFTTFLRYLVDLIPVGRLLMFRKHIDQHHVSEFLFFFLFFFSGGLIFLLIFFNVLMMYKNIFFYTFRNFLEFVIIKIVSKSRFSQKWKSRMFIFERASLNFDTVYEVILMYFIKA